MLANSLSLSNVLFSYFTVDTNTIYDLEVIFSNIFYVIFNQGCGSSRIFFASAFDSS